MSSISSGVGIFSGINSAQLIDQLLAIDARPKQQIQQRVVGYQQQRAAYLDINGSLLTLRTAAQKFRTGTTFRASKAESSDPEALTANAGTSAAAGSYSFVVKRLVSTQQQLSRGFTDSDTAGVGATSITFELGGGRVDSETKLSELNGGAGVERGKIVVTDAAGATATVDLSTAITVGDVLNAINTASGVRVSATVDGDRIKITDKNTSGSGSLTVANAAGYNTATSLGIAKTAAAGFGQAVTGDRVRTISGNTALSTLNDGRGVNIRDGEENLKITDRRGVVHRIRLGEEKTTTGTPPNQTTTVTQTRASTVQDVINYINAQGGGRVTAALNADKTGIVINDLTNDTDHGPATGNLTVENSSDTSSTAQDLGIFTGTSGVTGATVAGKRLISAINSTLVSSLKGGAGVTDTTLTIVDRTGNSTDITLSSSAQSGSVTDLIDNINSQLAADSSGVRVSFNRAGNGLALSDELSGGSGNISASGDAATALGIAATGATGGSINGTNLQSKWIGLGTSLSSLNGGKGVGTGTIRITGASGTTNNVTVGSSVKTVDDLVRLLNGALPTTIRASINSSGDGIAISDTSGSAGELKIEDVSGTVAKNLNLVGKDNGTDGSISINGSYERKVTFNATDSLNTVVSKINSAGVNVAATVIRDGSGNAPYRLSLTSTRTGTIGRISVDTGSLDLGLSSLVRGDDAVAFFGSGDPARAVALTSSSNTLDNVVQGVTIDLKQTSDTPISLVVSRDTAAVEKAVADFIDAYNKTIDKLDRYDNFNSETQTRSTLFGDSTIVNLRGSLRNVIQGTPQGVVGSFSRLFQAGVSVGEGSKLEFDREKFRSALEQDPTNVEQLFAARVQKPRESQVELTEIGDGIFVNNTSSQNEFTSLGIAEKLAEMIGGLTSSVDGSLTRRSRTIDDQINSQNQRIVSLDVRLASKRARLERQFTEMEKAIAALQSQSGALSSLSSIR